MTGRPAPGVHIRAGTGADIPALAGLIQRSIRVLGPRHYSPAQIAAWASRAPDAPDLRRRWADGRTVLIAADRSDRPLAVADLEADGHIDLFYAAPEAAGTGVASGLYGAIEEAARQRGIARLTVEASEGARRLFERKGFRVVARRDFEIDGVSIHNYAMEKEI